MPFDLYVDQQRDVEALRAALRLHKTVLYVLPTGGGKTVVSGWQAQALRQRGRRILILVHRRELVRQFHQTLCRVGLDNDVGIICPGFPATPAAPIQISMIFSWCRRKPDFRPDFIFVDEAHHARASSYETVLGWYPDAWILGMTATPRRLDQKGLGTHFAHMHVGSSIPDLIEDHRLAPVRTLYVPAHFVRKKLPRTHGDFNRAELDRRATGKVVGASVTAYQRYIPGRRTIMFGVSKRHARETAEQMCADGIAAAYVGDDTPQKVRDATFERFSDGLIDVICNVALVDEGFDVPACDAVMDVAPTCSVTRFLQRVGRCMRYQPGKEAVFLDLVGNVHFHGLPDVERSWSLETGDGQPKQTSDADTGLRHCKSCHTVFNARHEACPKCGAVHQGDPITEVDVDLLEGDPNAQPISKPGRPQPKMNKTQRASMLRTARQLRAQGKPVEAWALIRDTANHNEYGQGWAHIMAGLAGIDREHRT